MTADQVARDLCRMIDDVPVVFKLGDSPVVYTGTRGSLVAEKRNVAGGVFEAPELTITTCLKKVNHSGKLVNRFPTDGEPVAQNALKDVGGITGRNYRIIRTHRDEFDAALQMDLESIHK